MSSEENKNMNEQEEIQRKPDGYVSIIPDTLFDKVIALSKVVEELSEEIFHLNESMIGKDKPDDYQMFQYVAFLDFVDEIRKNTSLATQIHRLDGDFIDKSAKEQGLTTSQYVSKFMVNQMFNMLRDR